MTVSTRIPRFALFAAAVALAAVLVVFALRTYRELSEMQRIYLRDKASMLVDRLEIISPEQLGQPLEIPLRRLEPGIISIQLYRDSRTDDPPAVQAIRGGKEFSRTEEVTLNERKVFRAWMLFHSAQGL